MIFITALLVLLLISAFLTGIALFCLWFFASSDQLEQEARPDAPEWELYGEAVTIPPDAVILQSEQSRLVTPCPAPAVVTPARYADMDEVTPDYQARAVANARRIRSNRYAGGIEWNVKTGSHEG